MRELHEDERRSGVGLRMAKLAYKCVEGVCDNCVRVNEELCERVYSCLILTGGVHAKFQGSWQKNGPIFPFF